MALQDFLGSVALFGDLSSEELIKVESLATERSYRKGDVILNEGDAGVEFFVVAEGVVAINKNVAGGRKRNLANLKKGEVFGEIIMFDNEPRSASAEAAEDTHIVVFRIQEFKKLMDENLELCKKVQRQIISVLCERLRNTSNLLKEGVIWGFKTAV